MRISPRHYLLPLSVWPQSTGDVAVRVHRDCSPLVLRRTVTMLSKLQKLGLVSIVGRTTKYETHAPQYLWSITAKGLELL